MSHPLSAVSPVDGRYYKATRPLAPYLSEQALIKYRLKVMIEHVIALADQSRNGFGPPTMLDAEAKRLRKLADVSLKHANIVKLIETRGYGGHRRTNHDVKACELYLADRFEDMDLKVFIPWIHFGRTSEDVNNIAYALMLRDAVEHVLLPAVEEIEVSLRNLSQTYAETPMLARTHGQPASPTTFGKEMRVFSERLLRQVVQLWQHRFLAKLNGATGNYNADMVGLPHVDWIEYSKSFIGRFNDKKHKLHLEANLFTTQIEPHDTYAELFAILTRINTILLDFVQDMWRYISDDWVVQKGDGSVGSSTMPHKINPIDFENGEGNLGIANALLEFQSRKLAISRLQRDLSDSTVERTFGTGLGHCLIAYGAIRRGLNKVAPDEFRMERALADHPEVITEAIQTILRREGKSEAYNRLKDFSQGKRITMADIALFIENLDVEERVKAELRTLTPVSYVGLAPTLAVLHLS